MRSRLGVNLAIICAAHFFFSQDLELLSCIPHDLNELPKQHKVFFCSSLYLGLPISGNFQLFFLSAENKSAQITHRVYIDSSIFLVLSLNN